MSSRNMLPAANVNSVSFVMVKYVVAALSSSPTNIQTKAMVRKPSRTTATAPLMRTPARAWFGTGGAP